MTTLRKRGLVFPRLSTEWKSDENKGKFHLILYAACLDIVPKCFLPLFHVVSEGKKRNCLASYPQREQPLSALSVWLANTSHSLLLTRRKTDYRYPGIKDTSLPGDTLLLVLTLVNITVTRSTYGAATLLMCAFGQNILLRAELGTLTGDGVEAEVAESVVQRGPEWLWLF